ncbi:MAG: hypothetical protein LBR26_09890 [Prevotella sp.]|jgi:hypothetical protein|nr:hypothetical protein [Prevotella sp.]
MSKINVVIFRLKGLMSLSQKVVLNGKEVRVEYSGGGTNGNTIIGGRYISRDAGIIEAIKASQRFKDGQIYIESSTYEDVKEYKLPDETAGLKDAIALGTSSPDETAGNPDLLSELVANQQQAREFMTEKGIGAEALNKILSATDLVSFAKEKGFTFPNWRAFNE